MHTKIKTAFALCVKPDSLQNYRIMRYICPTKSEVDKDPILHMQGYRRDGAVWPLYTRLYTTSLRYITIGLNRNWLQNSQAAFRSALVMRKELTS